MVNRTQPPPASPDVPPPVSRRRRVMVGLLVVLFLGVSVLWVVLLPKVVDALLAMRPAKEDREPTGVHTVAFSPDGNRIVLGSQASRLEVGAGSAHSPFWGHLQVWDAQTGQETHSLNIPTGLFFGMAFSPDGKRIVSGGYGYNKKTRQVWGEVKVWDAQTGQEQLSLK